MVGVNNLTVDFSAKPLFNNISFSINDGERIALVGKNGAGKSTLLKILASKQSPTSGNISKPNDFSIGYLPQEMLLEDETTLLEETKKAFADRIALETKLNEIHTLLAERTDYESTEYLQLIKKADDLSYMLNIRFPENMDAEIERTLIGLGFKPSDFNRPTSEFSGGWRMRIELAKILLQKPDLLLLDEPTNHLDINSIIWLEQFLTTKAGAVLLVSHDKAFLDNVTSRTIEISCGKIYDYKVSYTPFVKLREERIEQQTKAYVNQQKMIADTKDFIERFRYKATKAVQVQSRIKQLEKIVPIEIDETDTSSVSFSFPPAERSGDFPLTVDNVSKSYGDHLIFSEANLSVRRGEKIAFIGSNGEGKTTMIKCIMGEIPFEGDLKIGHNVKIGYFAQNQAQKLDPNKTVFETLDYVATGDIRTKLKDLLAAFLFRGEDIDKKVSVLSGGEKTRLAMAKLLLEPMNFLILDEPTNHLDMRTKDVLKQALKKFNGTVIIVSHDREFMDGLVDKVFVFANQRLRENIGGEFGIHLSPTLSKQLTSNGKQSPQSSVEGAPQSFVEDAVNQESQPLSYNKRKERDRKIRKAEKAVEKSESEVMEIEEKISEMETQMTSGNCDEDFFKQYSDMKKRLEIATENWELALNELEELKKDYGIN